MRVLITAPSLSENENVSGISTLIRAIISRSSATFVHFPAGRKDGDKFDVNWILAQAKLPFAFGSSIKREKPDVVHINTAFEPRAIIRDLVLAGRAKAAGRPVVLHLHNGRFVLNEFTSAALARRAEKLLKKADKIIVLGNAERDNLLKRTPGLDITVLPNAVQADKVPEREPRSGEKTILFFGRLNMTKGLNDIVEVCRMLLEQGFKFKFACYGAGPDREPFVSDMGGLLDENFHDGGVAFGPKKWQALSEADIFLLPSRHEGLPMAMLEAMAAGCVPVVSDVGTISDVVKDGRNGFFIEPGNLTQIAGRLKMLLSENDVAFDEFCVNARKTIRERFNFTDYIVKLDKIYKEVSARSVSNV